MLHISIVFQDKSLEEKKKYVPIRTYCFNSTWSYTHEIQIFSFITASFQIDHSVFKKKKEIKEALTNH